MILKKRVEYLKDQLNKEIKTVFYAVTGHIISCNGLAVLLQLKSSH